MTLRIRAIILVLFAVICGLCGSITAQSAVACAAIPTPMDQRGVMQDLSEMTIDGQAFDAELFAATHHELTVIHVAEYCYSADAELRRNFALYVYVYNPNGVPLAHASGKIQLSDSWDRDGNPIGYKKYPLTALSANNNLYYKYKVDGFAENADKLNAASRRYDVSGIEIATLDNPVKEYAISETYIYAGFAEGYGGEYAIPLTCVNQELYTLTVNVTGQDTAWRNDMDNPDLRDRNQLNSVWFSIPRDVIDHYGNLQRIKAEWNEYRTQPILITTDETMYKALRTWVGVNVGERTTLGTLGYKGVSGLINELSPSTVCYTSTDTLKYNLLAYGGADGGRASWSYNVTPYEHCAPQTAAYNPQQRLRWLFSTDKAKLSRYVVSSEKLLEAASVYPYRDVMLPDLTNEYPADLFTSEVGAGRTAGRNVKDFYAKDLIEWDRYDPVNSGWRGLGAYLGLLNNSQSSMPAVAPIRKVTSGDLRATNIDIADTMCIAEYDVDELREYVRAAESDNRQTYLFSYAMTNYNTLPVRSTRSVLGGFMESDVDAVVVSENVFFDFDVIEFEFTNGAGKRTVLPVVMTPTDIFPDAEVPQQKQGLPWWVWLIIGVIALLILGVLCVLIKPIWLIVKAVLKVLWWIVSAPVRGVIWVVRKIKDRKGGST